MDRTALQAWLDRYVEAWKTYDPDEIGDLFAETATYRYHPYDEDDDVVTGRAAIVEGLDRAGGRRQRPRRAEFLRRAVRAVRRRRRPGGGGRLEPYWTDGTRAKLESIYDNVTCCDSTRTGAARVHGALHEAAGTRQAEAAAARTDRERRERPVNTRSLS